MTYGKPVICPQTLPQFAHFALASLLAAAVCGAASAQQASPPTAGPDYRLARDVSVSGSAAAAFDLTQQPGEHPLQPLLRATKGVIKHIDENVRDYTCTLYKRERIDDDLGDPQHLYLKVRHEPFSVYMNFLQPYQGREVLFVTGQNEGKLLALESGWKRKLGMFQLDPQGVLAMSGQKYPVTKIGIRNLMVELLEGTESDLRFGECEVTVNPDSKIDGRSATLVQVTHPVPRREFRNHITRLFLDNEMRVPVHYDSFTWPERKGGQPQLDESYTYRNMKLNTGLGARDFDKDNPEIFRP